MLKIKLLFKKFPNFTGEITREFFRNLNQEFILLLQSLNKHSIQYFEKVRATCEFRF